MGGDREELIALRRLAELEAKASGAAVSDEKSTPFSVGAFVDTVKGLPGYAGRAALGALQGASDLPLGVAQLASKALPDSVGAGVNDFIKRRDEAFDRSGASPIGRVSGNILGAAGIGPAKAAITLPGRIAQGMKAGGILGAASPVNPDSEEFWKTKGIQTAVGVGAGGLLPPVVEGIAGAISGTINKVAPTFRGTLTRMTGASSEKTIESTLAPELEKQGVSWANVPAEIRNATLADVKAALNAGRPVDAATAARLAQFKSLGVAPTAGQVSRDPHQFALEQNLARTEAGAPISQRIEEQNRQFIQTLGGARKATGATQDVYGAGESAIAGLKATDAPRKAAEDAAFGAARKAGGAFADVPFQPVSNSVHKIVEDYGDDAIMPAVMKRLRDFAWMSPQLGGKPVRAFTVNEVDKLKTLINNNWESMNPAQRKASNLLRNSLDEALGEIPASSVGTEAAKLFGQARDISRARRSIIGSTPAMEAALDRGVAPDKFIEQHFIRSAVQDVQKNVAQLTPGAAQEMRGSVLEWLKTKAVGGATDETAKFSQKAYGDALNAIGVRRLEAMGFSPQEIQQLMALRNVSALSMSQPTTAGVNRSATATTLLDQMDRMSRLPIVGALAGKPGDIFRGAQATRATQQPLMPVQESLLIPPDIRSRYAGLLGVGAAPIGGIGGGLLGR